MAQNIIWDNTGEKTYETGVDHGVLFPMDTDGSYPVGVAWNGLTTVTESPSGAESTPLYADNIKYLNLLSAEQLEATVEAYTYPDEFGVCDGSAAPTPGVAVGQQTRKQFGLCYRTVLGNDTEGQSHGYKLHLMYGCQASPSEKAYGTINDSPSAISFSWKISTTPVPVTNYKPTALMIIDSSTVDSTKLAALEAILFGVDAVNGRLPLPNEVISILTETAPSAVSVTSVPVDDATGVAVTANVVLTFNNKILREAVVVASAAGVMVPVVKTWDGAGKVLTLDPVSNLSGGTTYIVTIAGVVDVYNQALAASARNFATT